VRDNHQRWPLERVEQAKKELFGKK
jgi:hypothetical protein